MVTEEELLHSDQYQFQYIQIQVLEQTKNGEVIAFGAKYNTKPDKDYWISNGVNEAHITIWQPKSHKRPKGYFIYFSFDLPNDETVCVFVDQDWFFEQWSHDEQEQKLEEYKASYLQKVERENIQNQGAGQGEIQVS